MKQAKWTQDEAVAFECAREAITELMSIYTSRITRELARTVEDSELLKSLREERSRLAAERLALRVDQHADIARIRREYGAAIRAYHQDHAAAA